MMMRSTVGHSSRGHGLLASTSSMAGIDTLVRTGVATGTAVATTAAGAELDVPNDSYGKFMDGVYRVFNQPFERVLGGGVNETIDPSVWKKWYAQRQYRPQPLENAMQAGSIVLGSGKVA